MLLTTSFTRYLTAGVNTVTDSYSDAYVLEVCTAIITKNEQSAVKLLEQPMSQSLPVHLRNELVAVARAHPPSATSGIVRFSYYLPAWMQYVGQRAVLFSPRFGYWLLRKTKLHHRWY